jgi:hypothetical protein
MAAHWIAIVFSVFPPRRGDTGSASAVGVHAGFRPRHITLYHPLHCSIARMQIAGGTVHWVDTKSASVPDMRADFSPRFPMLRVLRAESAFYDFSGGYRITTSANHFREITRRWKEDPACLL